MIVVLLILSFIMFLLYNLLPGNRAYTDARTDLQSMKNTIPADQREAFFEERYLFYQRRYGTDTDNQLIRYLRWVGVYPMYDGSYNGLLQGNFGYSYDYQKDVIECIKQPMKNTIFINIFATILGLGITIPLGIFCAVKRGSKRDGALQVFSIIGYSLPVFLIAILFIWIFCSKLGWFPPSGQKTPGSNFTGWAAFADRMKYLALPLIVMTFCSLGGMIRYVRAAMIDALSMDCIKTARAKGLREKVVIFSHAWRNALIPIVTLVIGWFTGIFVGSLMIERMFALNGMGDMLIRALTNNDSDLIIILQLFYVAISLLGNLIVDLTYGLVDPRVRVNK